MEFGRISENQYASIDYTLPINQPFNTTVLSGNMSKEVSIYIGCSKWGRSEWVGKIFPKATPEREYLPHYAHHFNSLELNATHYKIYDRRTVEKWAEKSRGKGFLYCPKMYQGITHEGSLSSKHVLTDNFLSSVTYFEEQLGPIFIQLSDNFGVKRKQELFDYIERLPVRVPFFLEVRNHDWFERQEIREELLSVLREFHIGSVITDTYSRRECAHMQLTVPKTLVRFVGQGLHATDYARIDLWVEAIKNWMGQGLESLYFFMHLAEESYFPELATYLIDNINEQCKTNIRKPSFIKHNLLF